MNKKLTTLSAAIICTIGAVSISNAEDKSVCHCPETIIVMQQAPQMEQAKRSGKRNNDETVIRAPREPRKPIVTKENAAPIALGGGIITVLGAAKELFAYLKRRKDKETRKELEEYIKKSGDKCATCTIKNEAEAKKEPLIMVTR